jgi:tetratricopeptide (TPR) repeat protein
VDTVRMLYPTYPTLPGMYKLISEHYIRTGWESYGRVGKFAEAIGEYRKGLEIDSTNADLWYNVGGAYYSNKRYAEAIEAFKMSLKYKPGNPQAQNGIMASTQLMNQAQRTEKVNSSNNI